MASSLETKVLSDHKLNDLPKVKPQIHTQETIKPVISPSKRKNYSKLTISLISVAFALLTSDAIIYFHSVQVQKNSNLMQSKIVEMKEYNYRLNVELAKTKELSKVEEIAKTDLQMMPSLNAKINYLILPVQMTNKEYLITRVLPDKKKLSILTGF